MQWRARTLERDARRDLLRLIAAGGVMSVSPFAFAQGTPKKGGTLTIGADADPIGFDPVTLTAFSSYDFTSLLYTGLLRWNAEMKVEPDLATGFEQTSRNLGHSVGAVLSSGVATFVLGSVTAKATPETRQSGL